MQYSSFASARADFPKHGVLVRHNYSASLEEVLEYQTAYVEQWGMDLTAGNWAYHEDFPIVLLPDAEMPEEAYPLTEDGRPFRFVASVPGWHYRGEGADSILLFFDPETRTALLTFEIG